MYLPRLGQLAVLAAVGLSLSACATLDVRSYVERGAVISQYRTYNWNLSGALATGDPRLDNNPFFHERVQADIEKQLAARGFEKTTSETADVLIHYHASISQDINLNGANEAYATSCESCEPYVYEAGTLVIDLVDAQNNRLVWRGWAEGVVDGIIDSQDLLEQRVDEAVSRILERLPRRL